MFRIPAIFVLACSVSLPAIAQNRVIVAQRDIESAPPEVRASALKWMSRYGIDHAIEYPSKDRVRFQYGGPTWREMSVTDFGAFVEARLRDHTYVSAVRASPTETEHGLVAAITYVSTDHRLAFWRPGDPNAHFARYQLKTANQIDRTGRAQGSYVCLTYDEVAHSADGKVIDEVCEPSYSYLTGRAGERQGDVFGLMSGKVPSILNPASPPTWPDGSALIADKAPHD